VLVEDCVVGPNYNPPVDASGNANFSLGCGQERNHATVVKSNGGCKNAIIRNNTLIIAECSCASSISSFYPEVANGGPNSNITFEGNLLVNSGAAGLFYCGYTPPGESPNTNFIYRNNWVSTLNGTYSGWITDHWDDGRGPTPRTWTNNKWYDQKPTGGGYTNKYGQGVNP
jgi:hypothetical protein